MEQLLEPQSYPVGQEGFKHTRPTCRHHHNGFYCQFAVASSSRRSLLRFPPCRKTPIEYQFRRQPLDSSRAESKDAEKTTEQTESSPVKGDIPRRVGYPESESAHTPLDRAREIVVEDLFS